VAIRVVMNLDFCVGQAMAPDAARGAFDDFVATCRKVDPEP
jgi:hypothetical protein